MLASAAVIEGHYLATLKVLLAEGAIAVNLVNLFFVANPGVAFIVHEYREFAGAFLKYSAAKYGLLLFHLYSPVLILCFY